MNMNKKSIKLNISLIPLVLLLLLGLGAYYVFFTDQELIKLNKNPEVRRLNGFPAISYTEKDFEERTHVIINSNEELAEFLNLVDESGFLTVRENIDFEKELLIGVYTSSKDTTGYRIKAKELLEDKENNEILVSFRETRPGKTCEDIEEKKNIAVDLVAISRTEHDLDFETITEIKECE